ncbi:MAG: hypothetical protein WC498_00910 [Candidatus Saccharimonadales bacterium]
MSPQDNYTFNPLSNDDKELLLSHGYKPGELPHDDEQELIRDLRAQVGDDIDSDKLSQAVPAEERDS